MGDAQELSKWAKMTLEASPDAMKRRREVRSLEHEWRFAFPTAVVFDAHYGRLIVADTQRNRLQIYNKLKNYQRRRAPSSAATGPHALQKNRMKVHVEMDGTAQELDNGALSECWYELQRCLPTPPQPTSRQPHTTPSARASLRRGLSQLGQTVNAAERGLLPLKLSEWNELAQQLERSSLKSPAALQGHSAAELAKELAIADEDAERLVRLLDARASWGWNSKGASNKDLGP